MTGKITEDVRAAISDHAEAIATDLLGRHTAKTGSSLRFGAKRGIDVVISGAKAGLWKDHGRDEGGDLIALAQRELGCPFKEAARYCAQYAGIALDSEAPAISEDELNRKRQEYKAAQLKAAKEDAEARKKKKLSAKGIWENAKPLKGTPAEKYLLSRLGGIKALPDQLFEADSLRWFSCNGMWGRQAAIGAMVGYMINPCNGAFMGAHLTFIDNQAQKIDRLTYGGSGAIKLIDPEKSGEALTGLSIAEGIETALSALVRYNYGPIWATVNAGNMANFPPLPYVEALTVFADNDASGAGQEAANKCLWNWQQAGHEVTGLMAPLIGTDFNDLQKQEVA